MKKYLKIFTLASCIWAAFMLALFIFLSLCVEFQWTFIYNLPTALDWILSNIFILLYQAGRIGVPILTAVMIVLAVIICVKEKNAKSIDLTLVGTTLVFAVTASIISAMDSGIIAAFV